VGLASYLLIGFFYREKKAVSAAMKAFLTTRVGDVFLLFAIFLAVIAFGTLDMATMKSLTVSKFPAGSTIITIACLCLLGAASGKSAQLPLQTWLADAMWGPTPVSALIHAATMVTAGVYLLVRMSFLVVTSPVAQMAIMLVGLATLIMAGVAALVQSDMKRVLAYSTMSQIGYMFLAVGALAFQAAIFHLVTHAFFKALLFLSAGIIGHALHSYDLNAMGGLRKSLPAVFWFFVVGSASLMGLPLLGAGFFSKEWILHDVAGVPDIGIYLFYGAVFGTFLTALYTVRMLMLAFFGAAKKPAHDHAGMSMYGAVSILAIFSFFIGWVETPHFVADVHLVADFLSSSVPISEVTSGDLLWLLPTAAALLGAFVAYLRNVRVRALPTSGLVQFAKDGLGFDRLYQTLIVKPYQRLAEKLQPDFIKASYDHLVEGIQEFFAQIAIMHTGRLAHYLSLMMVALVALASIMVFS
jgi:NADH-quinone oxidoreductase subunit L